MVLVLIKLPNGTLKKVYYDGYLQELLDGFKHAVKNHNTSVVIILDGRSGMGKTTLDNQIGYYCDKNFGLHKVHFTPESFLEGLAGAKKGDFIAFDEAMLLSNRNSLSSINKMIVQAMSMIRSKNIFVAFCINSLFDLDRNLAISRADCLLHVYGQTLIDRGRFATFFRAKDGVDRLKQLYLYGKKMYDYGRPKANFIGSFTKEFLIDEIEYEKLKQKGVNEFLRSSEPKISRAEKSRNNLMWELHNVHGYDVPKLMEVADLKRTQTFQILRKMRENA